MSEKNEKKPAVDAEAAAKTEVQDVEKIELKLTLRGKDFKFEVPASYDLLPFDAQLAIEKGQHLTGLSYALGEVQLNQLRRFGATVQDFYEVMDALNEAWGLGND